MDSLSCDIGYLKQKARSIRRSILEMIHSAKKGHIGGAFSCTDILVSLYFGGGLRYDPSKPDWEARDRFILSKGHAGSALFAVLADAGFFDTAELATYCKNGGRLGGHPDRRLPGVEADTGSLGHGPGIAAGMALAAKINKAAHRIFVLLGDGECAEGSVWEAFAFAAHHRLDNLTAVIDRNGQCVLDYTEHCAPLEPFKERLESFGWEVREIDGHSFPQLQAHLCERARGKPLAIIAKTIKGKGVSFMEGQLRWHHSIPTPAEYALATNELACN